MICKVCQIEFVPRDGRQKCCSKACGAKKYTLSSAYAEKRKQRYQKNKAALGAARRARYQNDANFRERIVVQMRKRRSENPEKAKAISAKCRDNPERREKARQVSRAWHAENKTKANSNRRIRLDTQRVTHPYMTLVKSAAARAKKQNLPFDLTYEWAKDRWTGTCEVTGIPFKLAIKRPESRTYAPSIDKIIPSLGYTKENCRFVLWAVNAFKYDGTNEDMFMIAEAILKNRIK